MTVLGLSSKRGGGPDQYLDRLGMRGRTRGGTDVRPAAAPQDVIGYLRGHEVTLTWDPAAATLRARAPETAKTVTVATR